MGDFSGYFDKRNNLKSVEMFRNQRFFLTESWSYIILQYYNNSDKVIAFFLSTKLANGKHIILQL